MEQPPPIKHEGEMVASRQYQNCVLSFANIMCIVRMLFAEWFLLSEPYRTAVLESESFIFLRMLADGRKKSLPSMVHA